MGIVELRVKEVAKAKGITNPHQLAEATGVNYSICHRLYNGPVTNIALPTLAKLCEGLNVAPGELLTYIRNGQKRHTAQGNGKSKQAQK
jgi:DNA-binding Xre family transcriptional regulator